MAKPDDARPGGSTGWPQVAGDEMTSLEALARLFHAVGVAPTGRPDHMLRLVLKPMGDARAIRQISDELFVPVGEVVVDGTRWPVKGVAVAGVCPTGSDHEGWVVVLFEVDDPGAAMCDTGTNQLFLIERSGREHVLARRAGVPPGRCLP